MKPRREMTLPEARRALRGVDRLLVEIYQGCGATIDIAGRLTEQRDRARAMVRRIPHGGITFEEIDIAVADEPPAKVGS